MQKIILALVTLSLLPLTLYAQQSSAITIDNRLFPNDEPVSIQPSQPKNSTNKQLDELEKKVTRMSRQIGKMKPNPGTRGTIDYRLKELTKQIDDLERRIRLLEKLDRRVRSLERKR